MRIRKRMPARDADPGPAPPLPASSPPRAPPLQHPKERSREEEDEAEEKRVILVAGVRDDQGEFDDRVPAAASNDDSTPAMDDAPKPEPRDAAAAAAAVIRCSRNDGKRWRCKSAAVPGYLFCDRHVAWSTRKRKPRPNKHKKQHATGRGGVLGHAAPKDEAASVELGRDDGFLAGFRKRKRAKGGGPGPAA